MRGLGLKLAMIGGGKGLDARSYAKHSNVVLQFDGIENSDYGQHSDTGCNDLISKQAFQLGADIGTKIMIQSNGIENVGSSVLYSCPMISSSQTASIRNLLATQHWTIEMYFCGTPTRGLVFFSVKNSQQQNVNTVIPGNSLLYANFAQSVLTLNIQPDFTSYKLLQSRTFGTYDVSKKYMNYVALTRDGDTYIQYFNFNGQESVTQTSDSDFSSTFQFFKDNVSQCNSALAGYGFAAGVKRQAFRVYDASLSVEELRQNCLIDKSRFDNAH